MDFRLDTPHLRIYSARPLPFARQTAAILESEYGAYVRDHHIFWKLKELGAPVKVFLFRDRVSFEKNGGPLCPFMSSDTMGFYLTATQTLYVGCSANPHDPDGGILTNAAHEMTHALDDLLAGMAPALDSHPWVREGRAEYWGLSLSNRRILPGAAVFSARTREPDIVAQAVPAPDLAALVSMDSTAYMKAGFRNYALSWALVHFLLHGEQGRHAEGFKRYLTKLQEKPEEANLEACLGVRVADLEVPFKVYAQKVLLPSVQRSK